MARRGTKFRFVEPPPRGSMRRKSPDSAPRLFEWLVDNGYVEAVTTIRSKGKRKARRRR